MKIRKGDTVQAISGASRGKKGKVLKVMPGSERITVEGVGLRFKHTRPRRQGQKGQKIEFPAPLHISNVALVCPQCNKVTRVGFSNEGGSKRRICRSCKQAID